MNTDGRTDEDIIVGARQKCEQAYKALQQQKGWLIKGCRTKKEINFSYSQFML
jgi:hypothetical protein